jgi:hypothetical protein
MSCACKTKIVVKAACSLLASILVCAQLAFAAEPAMPSSVDVYWKSTRTIVAPGVSTVVILDDDVAHAEIGNDTIEFAGLARGNTVALAYVNGVPISIVVHVIEHPITVIPPRLLRREQEMAHGSFGSDFQRSSGNSSNFTILNSLSWSQQIGDHAMNFNSQVEDNSQFGGHTANLRTAGLSYRTPTVALNVFDFSQSLSGASPEDHVNNFSSPSIMELRGASLTLLHGKNEYTLFGGSTIPYYFLSLDATRDVAGFSFHRKQTDKLNLFGSTDYANIPTNVAVGIQRSNYVMQNAGLSYRIGKSFLLGAQGGVSNRGGLVRADASYASFRVSGYGSAIFSSQTFPLNQLQSLFSGTSSFKGAISYRTNSRLSEGFYGEHTEISPGLIYRFKGATDYLSPNLALHIARGESFNLAYTYSRNSGGFSAGGATTGNRYDVSLNSELTPRIVNSAQVTIGSVQDPLQINSEDQFSARDSISIPIKSQTLVLGIEQDRVQSSLIAKLNQELGLLSPSLQADFLANPAAFIDSTNFPPEIKALLAAEQPTGTTFSASGNLAFGSKVRLNPNFSLTHSANGTNTESWTQSFGYSFSYQLLPTLQLRSSLNNVLLWDSGQNRVERTTILAAGFQKSFSATPGTLPLLHRSRFIEGRVFRDNNINGTYNSGEPGLPGVEVRLEDGQLAVTDEQGRYKFPSVSADQHQVSIALTQFRQPVRMTTSGEAEADLIQQRIAILNFGILDFARVMGNVYNDLRFENRRQPDSKGMQDIELLLENGKEVRKLQTSGAGDFELDNVPPGDYKLSLDPTSIPSNYLAPMESVTVHVSPVSTVVQDIPVRALRSISGNVLLKVTKPSVSQESGGKRNSRDRFNSGKTTNTKVDDAQGFTLVPVPGVQIAAGPATATTDHDGKFLLRNLPAGELSVTIKPVNPVPPGITIPKGSVKLPAEPVQIQGATIVISKADLLPYITRQFPNGSRGSAPDVVLTKKTEGTPALTVTSNPGSAIESTASSSMTARPVGPQSSAVPITRGMAQPPISNVVPHPSSDRSSASASLTRESCEKLPSLGEVAQCLRQLKLNTAGTPAR